MSKSSQRDHNSDDLSPYAPRWARERSAERRPRWDDARETPADWPEQDRATAEEGLVIDRLRVPRSLEPGFVPEPPATRHRPMRGKTVARLVLACAAAGGIAYVAVVRAPDFWTSEGRETPEQVPFSTRFDGQAARTPERAKPPAQLVSAPQAAKPAGEPTQLGLSVRGGEGGAIIVAGLPAGATLSAGYPFGAGGWRIPVAELGDVQVYPPRGFLGAMEIGIELRQPDDAVADRRSVRLEWTAPKAAEKTPPPPPAEKPAVAAKPPEPAPPAAQKPAAPPRVARLLGREEIDLLIRHGEEFLASGDISAARVTLKRAAEAQDARAALALASTYDPNVLEKLGVLGFKPDIALARAWYEKAREFGSPDAPRRLEMLASRER